MTTSNKKTVEKTTASKKETTQTNTTRKQLPTPPVVETATAEIITAENVQIIGERIAIKALKTVLSAGGNAKIAEHKYNDNKPIKGGNFNFLSSLYGGLIGDILMQSTHRETLEYAQNLYQQASDNFKRKFSTDRQGAMAELAVMRAIHKALTGRNFTDGYDIAQTAILFLCGYYGKNLQDTADNGETDKNGEPVTILRACFRAVNRYIMGERQHEYKRVFVDEIDPNGNTLYYEIPKFWDMPTATDYTAVNETIDKLQLSAKEMQFLRYRLRGYSLDTIAQKMGVKRDTLNIYRQRVKDKAQKIGIEPNA